MMMDGNGDDYDDDDDDDDGDVIQHIALYNSTIKACAKFGETS